MALLKNDKRVEGAEPEQAGKATVAATVTPDLADRLSAVEIVQTAVDNAAVLGAQPLPRALIQAHITTPRDAHEGDLQVLRRPRARPLRSASAGSGIQA